MSVLENGNCLLSYMQQYKKMFTEMFTDDFLTNLFPLFVWKDICKSYF